MAALIMGIDIGPSSVRVSFWNDNTGVADAYKEEFASIEEAMDSLKKQGIEEKIERVGITAKRIDKKSRDYLSRFFASRGFAKDKLLFMSHIDSFMWYEIYEGGFEKDEPSLCVDFDEKGMLAYVFHPSLSEKRTPYYVEYAETNSEYTEDIEKIENKEHRSKKIVSLVGALLEKADVSRLYVIGEFTKRTDEVSELGTLVRDDRRVYVGRTMFAQGVCYRVANRNFSKQVIYSEQTMYNIYMNAYSDAIESRIRILSAGMDPDKAEAKFSVIMDDTDRIPFFIEDIRNNKMAVGHLIVDMIEYREPKTNKIEVDFSFIEKDLLAVKVRDVGFGNVNPASYKVKERIFNLKEMIGA